MKKLFLYISIAIALMATSCDSYLDEKPKGYTIPVYFEDFALMLNSYEFVFLGQIYPTYMTDDVDLGDENAPTYFSIASKYEEELNMFKFKEGEVFNPSSDDYAYGSFYKIVYICNVVANNILNVPDGIQSEKERIWAEAIMHRSMCYFNLVNYYGKPYNKATSSTDLGVPIILSEDINSTYKRNSVDDVYKLMVKDLELAAPMLGKVSNHRFRPNQAAGYALLAKLYLHMGEYEKALANVNKSLDLNISAKLIDYKKFHALEEGSWGRIVDENGEIFPERIDSPEGLFVKVPSNSFGTSVCASDDLMAIYEKNLPTGAIDQRVALFYAKDSANTHEKMYFPGKTLYVNHCMPNVGIGLPDVMLIAAECEARVGNKDKAMDLINELRDMRIVNNEELSAATKEEALQIVVEERRRELAFHGTERFFDLRRLNLDPRFAKTVVHTAERGQSWSLPANDKRYVMPLPFSVRNFNPTIPQYDR